MSNATPRPSLGREVATAFLVSTAATAGLFAGMAVAGHTMNKMEERKARKLEKKATKNA